MWKKEGGKTINAKRKGEQGRTEGTEKDRRREAEDRSSRTERRRTRAPMRTREDWRSRG
jgi:hypothetical protein